MAGEVCSPPLRKGRSGGVVEIACTAPCTSPPLRKGRSGGVVEIALGGLAEQEVPKAERYVRLATTAVGRRLASTAFPMSTDGWGLWGLWGGNRGNRGNRGFKGP